MELYQSLYHLLFNAATDAIHALDRTDYAMAKSILIFAQRQAETIYMSNGDEETELRDKAAADDWLAAYHAFIHS